MLNFNGATFYLLPIPNFSISFYYGALKQTLVYALSLGVVIFLSVSCFNKCFNKNAKFLNVDIQVYNSE